MKTLRFFASLIAILGVAFFLVRKAPSFSVQAQAASSQSQASSGLAALAQMDPIDTHTHIFKNDPAFYSMLDRLHLHVLDICVADDHNLFRALGPQLAGARAFIRGSGGRASLCTTFDPFSFDKPGFSQRVIQQLNRDFQSGAVAVKIWKNIGMEVKGPGGKFVMPDDPVFEPIYKDIAEQNKTLIAHLAEPDSCWQPPNPASPDYDYYKEHPEWYMYLHPDHPSKQTILAARDHLLGENPNLRVVGAHLGSMETDVDLIARRFDRYPNFAVDMAARMEYLMLQPREKVRTFLVKYQDRVLYGTDLEFTLDKAESDSVKTWQDVYARDWKFLATDEILTVQKQQIHGLALPHSVLVKIYHDNAVRWIPGILPASKK